MFKSGSARMPSHFFLWTPEIAQFLPFQLLFIAAHSIPRLCLKTNVNICFLSSELLTQTKEWEANTAALHGPQQI